MLGMYFRKVVSADHLRDDVKDVVRLSTGLIGTIAALVLGLLIASAKNSYDARSTQFKQITANVFFSIYCWSNMDRMRKICAACCASAFPSSSNASRTKAAAESRRRLRQLPKHNDL